MLRSKSFYKSTPNLLSTGRPSAPVIVGRDELEERYLDLRDQHHELQRAANAAQDEVRSLHVKLSRLIEEKKRYFKHRRTEHEISLEEQIIDLERQLVRQSRTNDKLRDRLQLSRVQASDAAPQSHIRSAPVVGSSYHQALTATRTQRVASAYEHVTSRTDSGLALSSASSRRLAQNRSKSTLDLRAKSSIMVSNNTASSSATRSYSALPSTATMLMREAKDEIIRLETIVAEQQSLLDSLFYASPHVLDLSEEAAEAEMNGSLAGTPVTSAGDHQFGYRLTTTTTSTTSLTPAARVGSSGGSKTPTSKAPQSIAPPAPSKGASLAVNGTCAHSQSLDLWSRYQQLIARQESSNQISSEVAALLQSLYRNFHEEKQKVAQLRAKLAARQEYNLVIVDKEKQIESLRKENSILQQSLAQCVNTCMNMDYAQTEVDEHTSNILNDRRTTFAAQLEQIKSIFAAKCESFEREIELLTDQLRGKDENLHAERVKCEQLENALNNLKQLSENDQLHIKNLEAKVSRLSQIVFADRPSSGSITESVMISRDAVIQSSSEIICDNSSSTAPQSFNPPFGSSITDRLNQLLNALPS